MCFGFWEVFWILGSVFGFWEVFWHSRKCFGILGSVLDSGKCFVPMGHHIGYLKDTKFYFENKASFIHISSIASFTPFLIAWLCE